MALKENVFPDKQRFSGHRGLSLRPACQETSDLLNEFDWVMILTHTFVSPQADFQHKFTVQASPTMDKRKSLISSRSSPPASPTIIPRLRAIQCETAFQTTPGPLGPCAARPPTDSGFALAITSAAFLNSVSTHACPFADPQPSCPLSPVKFNAVSTFSRQIAAQGLVGRGSALVNLCKAVWKLE